MVVGSKEGQIKPSSHKVETNLYKLDVKIAIVIKKVEPT